MLTPKAFGGRARETVATVSVIRSIRCIRFIRMNLRS